MQNDIENQSDYLGAPGIPQAPEAPQPARPGGIPSWQTEPKNMIDDAMTRWTGPIGTEQDYEAVTNRLRYLEKYQPTLEGELQTRCGLAIDLLKERIDEFENKNVHFLMTKRIWPFLQARISNEVELSQANDFIARLQLKNPKFGETGRAVNLFIEKLEKIIQEYQK